MAPHRHNQSNPVISNAAVIGRVFLGRLAWPLVTSASCDTGNERPLRYERLVGWRPSAAARNTQKPEEERIPLVLLQEDDGEEGLNVGMRRVGEHGGIHYHWHILVVLERDACPAGGFGRKLQEGVVHGFPLVGVGQLPLDEGVNNELA